MLYVLLLIFGFVIGIAFMHYTRTNEIYTVHVSEHKSIIKSSVYVTRSLEDAQNWMRQNSFILEHDYQFFVVDTNTLCSSDSSRNFYDSIGFMSIDEPNPKKEAAIKWLHDRLSQLGYEYEHQFRFAVDFHETFNFIIDVPLKYCNEKEWLMEESTLEDDFGYMFSGYEIMFTNDKSLVNINDYKEIYICND